MRILIVEDEVRLAETLRQLMEDQRYQVDTVYDGADGVDYGLAGQYDLIILDVMLPKVDGFQVAPAAAGGPCIHPHSDAHRPGRGQRQDQRPGLRGGRLYDQAL